MRDLQKGDDAGLSAIAAIVDATAPDILVLTDFDYDLDGHALDAFAAGLITPFPYRFALAPNAGVPTGYDLDNNGYLGDARDAQGYGRFRGDGGMAILSRFPIMTDEVQDYSALLWRDLAGASLPMLDAAPFLSGPEQEVLRLSSTGHWVAPIALPGQSSLTLMVFAATPPVFDGPEDMNGLRNRDELRLWENILDQSPPAGFVIAGNANLDPVNGAGIRSAMADFLARPDVQDPHVGQPNADWGTDGPGRLRVSYVLPSVEWQVVDAGTVWPEDDVSGPHRLVWVDLDR